MMRRSNLIEFYFFYAAIAIIFASLVGYNKGGLNESLIWLKSMIFWQCRNKIYLRA